ncbi:helix-turn-helix domain-containing protein [Magnetospirillum fulvum]|uniref:Transcriptional regulator n=1 Tax=Magnetospirillum fulvum MGU-K5 TaxID=1316936 RepID=S9SGU6_MAGFU|nr:helix-turn-helix domain-containing protein [Magnetospirillum fulvum]EPY03333.1 transcriptional regulator [Magnetospirillum fulvum MGU-K5]
MAPPKRRDDTTGQPQAPRRKANRGRTEDGDPNPVDIHVGARVRLRRTLLGMSQEKLGSAIGLTFQQVQKYERGANRIGASRLFDLSQVLDVPVSFFYDDMPEDMAQATPAEYSSRATGLAEEPSGFDSDLLSRQETMNLIRAYFAIPDPHVRKRVYELAKALAATGENRD